MKLVDRLLAKMGLVRTSVHQAKMDGYRDFMRLLAAAAKEKGVRVMLDGEKLCDVEIDTDVFVVGTFNVIAGCDFTSATVKVAPRCENNWFVSNRFHGGECMRFEVTE